MSYSLQHNNSSNNLGANLNAAALFQYLDQAFDGSHKEKKGFRFRDKKREISKAQIKYVEQFLDAVDSKKKSLPELFHERLLQTNALLSSKVLQSYEELIKHLLQIPSELKKPRSVELSKEFLEYIQTHKNDPDNSLLGLPPTPLVLTKHCNFSAFSSSPQISSSISSIPSSPSSSPSPSASDDQLQHIMEQIIQLNEAIDKSSVLKELSRLSQPLKKTSSQKLKKGDLILARITQPQNNPQEKFLYGRVIKTEKHSCTVALSPDEKTVLTLSLDDIRPFSHEMKNLISNFRYINKLVPNPIDDFCHAQYVRIMDSLDNFLRNKLNIDMDLVTRLRRDPTNPSLLWEFKRVKTLTDQLQALDDNNTQLQTFIEELENDISPTTKDFELGLNHAEIYPLFKQQSLLQLRQVSVKKIVRNAILCSVEMCVAGLEGLKNEFTILTSGERKLELTMWWLQLIEDRANDFLKEKGYNFDVIPEDYIGQPPVSIYSVRENLQLIKEILNPRNDQHKVKKFVRVLRHEIYTRIDNYVEWIEACLGLEFREELDEKDTMLSPNVGSRLDIQMIESRFEARKNNGDEGGEWITNAINDLKYIREMKELETTIFSKTSETHSLRMSNVVPISGLILGKFHIIENQLLTVLDVWGGSTLSTPSAEDKKEESKKETDVSIQQTKEPQSPSVRPHVPFNGLAPIALISSSAFFQTIDQNQQIENLSPTSFAEKGALGLRSLQHSVRNSLYHDKPLTSSAAKPANTFVESTSFTSTFSVSAEPIQNTPQTPPTQKNEKSVSSLPPTTPKSLLTSSKGVRAFLELPEQNNPIPSPTATSPNYLNGSVFPSHMSLKLSANLNSASFHDTRDKHKDKSKDKHKKSKKKSKRRSLSQCCLWLGYSHIIEDLVESIPKRHKSILISNHNKPFSELLILALSDNHFRKFISEPQHPYVNASLDSISPQQRRHAGFYLEFLTTRAVAHRRTEHLFNFYDAYNSGSKLSLDKVEGCCGCCLGKACPEDPSPKKLLPGGLSSLNQAQKDYLEKAFISLSEILSVYTPPSTDEDNATKLRLEQKRLSRIFAKSSSISSTTFVTR